MPGDAERERRLPSTSVFVVHSEEAEEMLRRLASRGTRLTGIMPGAGSYHQGTPGIRGSWLLFGEDER
jgi:hypothetical protein